MAIRKTVITKEPFKNPEQIIIIAFEGEVTERIYMELLHYKRGELGIKKNVKLRVIDTKNNHPIHIIGELFNENDILDTDKVYVFMDVDDHFSSEDKYLECMQGYTKQKVIPIITNRCFELLLLLHVVDIEENENFITEMKTKSCDNKLMKLLQENVESQNKKWVNVKKRFDALHDERAQNFYKLFHENMDILIKNLEYIEKTGAFAFEIKELYSAPGTNALIFYKDILDEDSLNTNEINN